MDVKQLYEAIGVLLADDPKRAEEPVCLSVYDNQLTVSGITVVVESDEWLPGTILLMTEDIPENDDSS